MIRRPPRSTLFPTRRSSDLYEVNFEAAGFKKLARKDIPIRSTETLGLDVSLEVGNVVESIEVSAGARSEEHTSELQSLAYLVCRLLLEKKKKNIHTDTQYVR